MFIFRQSDNAITSITRFDNENPSYPRTNLLNKYTRSFAKSTTTSTVIVFTFTGREFALLNTNATSGVIYADKPSGASTTISTTTNITTDTDYEGTLIINNNAVVTISNNATVRVTGTIGEDKSIPFNLGNLKIKDVYFDMGSVGTWTVSLTLYASTAVEVGALVGGTYTQYGDSLTATRGQKQFGFQTNSANYEALREEIKNDDNFVVLPNRELTENDIFITYGKIQANNLQVNGNAFEGGRYVDKTSIKVI